MNKLINGQKALREIRRKELGTSLHRSFIALTAYSLRGDKELLLGEGFDGHVSKHIEIRDLMLEMKRVMGILLLG
jgi:CheY-like chemotaxis protein